ncbi:hypothetical protein GCM10009123_05170 [Kangiella japonica]|uniref:Helix-turn-helix domain-containing protein n=1 Tax=Kangiella japonica TaxID=647384 RepID=A0ABP3CE94_9GAMM
MYTDNKLNESALLHHARTTYKEIPAELAGQLSKLITLADQYPDALATRAVTAVLLGLKEPTLSYWACVGRGLPFVKSGRRCFYRLSDIKAYIEKHTFQHTGEV